MTRKYTQSKTTTTAKIRKLLVKGATVQEVVAAIKVSPQRVYVVRSDMRKKGLLPTGIAALDHGQPPPATPAITDTVTITSAKTTLPEYRDTSDIKQNADLIYRITQGRVEAAHAASEIEDGAIEKKHVKETMVYIAVFAIFAAALAIYIFAR